MKLRNNTVEALDLVKEAKEVFLEEGTKQLCSKADVSVN